MSGQNSSQSFGGVVDRLQTTIREWIAPLDEVAGLVPGGATAVLELGCGQGILIAGIAPRVARVIGVDYDERKCRMARERCRAWSHVTIVQGEIIAFLEAQGPESVDCIVLADTLASNEPLAQTRILAACARALRGNGTLLLKIMDRTPAWKYRFSLLVSNLVYGVLRLSISSGQKLHHLSGDHYIEQLVGLGFTTRRVAMPGQAYNPFSHAVILGVKAT